MQHAARSANQPFLRPLDFGLETVSGLRILNKDFTRLLLSPFFLVKLRKALCWQGDRGLIYSTLSSFSFCEFSHIRNVRNCVQTWTYLMTTIAIISHEKTTHTELTLLLEVAKLLLITIYKFIHVLFLPIAAIEGSTVHPTKNFVTFWVVCIDVLAYLEVLTNLEIRVTKSFQRKNTHIFESFEITPWRLSQFSLLKPGIKIRILSIESKRFLHWATFVYSHSCLVVKTKKKRHGDDTFQRQWITEHDNYVDTIRPRKLSLSNLIHWFLFCYFK